MEQAMLDRFEGEIAVLLVGAAQRPLEVSRAHLPHDVREGQWLMVELHDDTIVRVTIDTEATAAAQQRIQEKLARLRRGEHLR